MTEAEPLVDAVIADRYRIVRKIAEGGMCIIYEAQHIQLSRSFALKALLPQLVRNQEAVHRFEREAELLAGLRHPNIVDISDWITLPDGAPCMVLEFLHGAPLQVRLQREPLGWDAIARIADQALSALALAHRVGITHRDLKPENIFISIDDVGDERVKLLDFGISKQRGVGRLSGAHQMLGTPSYMSPEQASGDTDLVGPSTDVWAMGAILYEMATQRTAFKADSLMDTLTLILTSRPEPMTTFRPDAPAAFVELVDHALSTDMERRIQTIEELRTRLRAALEPRTRIATPVAGSRRLTPLPVAAPLPPVPAPAASLTTSPAATPRRWWIVAGVAAAVLTIANITIALAM